MESVQIQGKHFSACQLRGFLRQVADSVPQDANIVCGIESTNQYEILSTFSFDDYVISLSLFSRKGGIV